jgi:predicted permease
MAFYDALVDRLRTTPGVERAAETTDLPFTGVDDRLDLDIERRPQLPSSPRRAHPRLVSAGYFAALGVPLVRGRVFDAHDDGSARPVVVINQAAQRRYWLDEDPIGTRIRLGGQDAWMTIVGIVGDVHHGGLDAAIEPEAFMPLAQGFDQLGSGFERSVTVVVRTDANRSDAAGVVRGAVAAVDPQQPVGAIHSMEALIAQSVAPERLNLLLLGAFAFVAVVLTAAGLYGVMSHLVGQRTREMGVRIALGATGRQVTVLVLAQAGLMMIAGVGTGIVAALALSRAMTSLLFGVSAADPWVYVVVAAVVIGAGLVAVAVPCRRAASIDPLVAMRQD